MIPVVALTITECESPESALDLLLLYRPNNGAEQSASIEGDEPLADLLDQAAEWCFERNADGEVFASGSETAHIMARIRSGVWYPP